MKKKKVFSKILAIVLVLSLMLSAFPSISVFAQEASGKEKLTEKGELWQPESNSNALNFEGDLSIKELQSAKLSGEDTPEIVSQESIEENGHVNRLWEQEEDLNSIVFQNRDGTKTMYYYNYPVKYKDANGKIKDKKNKLTDTGNEYANVENDINSYFPKKVHKNKGVILQYDNVRIEVAPLINGSSGASRQTGHNKDGQNTDYVEYPNVFDKKISLRYTPTFNGYKEDIILQENVGINEFQFRLTTSGLQLIEEYGFLYLSNPLTGQVVASIGDIIVYDSASFIKEDIPTHKPKLDEVTSSEIESIETHKHSYHIQTVVEDQEYILTMIVDKNYLSDSERVYPVYIDPTVKIEQNDSIQDATIYSNYNVNDGNNAYLYVGYQGSKGTARSLVRFPGLMNHSTLKNISVDQIESVKYIPIELHRGSGLWVDAYAATQYWTQSGVKCNSTIWNAYGNFIDDAYMSPYQGTDSDGNNVGTGNWYPFDITSIYKSWRNGAYGGVSNHYGIMLKAYQEGLSTVAQLGSAQHSSLFPSVMVKYNTHISVSQVCLELSTLTLNVNDTYYLDGSVVPSNATNQTIYYESSNTNVATVGYTSGLVCASSPGVTIITARSAADGSKYATCTVNVKYSFDMSIQNDYPDGCEMGDKNYASFGVYADNLKYELNKEMNEIFDYRGKNSWSNDFKNKNAPGATHSYTNIDDVDLMIFTGHGYAKNRNKSEGLFNYNSMHFGTTNSSVGHPEGNGTIASANFTTEDALYFGYNAKTKWLLAYTCNFLNEKQGDPNVFNMLDRGGRLIMGLSTKSYIVGKEGTDFGQYLLEGYSFKDAFFMAGEDNQDQGSIPIINSNQAKKYAILYYGSEDAGTLNDKITEPLDNVAKTEGKIKTKIINKYWFNDFEED